MTRALPFLLAVAFSAATGAQAQEAIPTAANAPSAGAPATSPGARIDLPDRDEDADEGPLRVGPCGNVAPIGEKTPNRAHGAVWAGAGTHGYREIGGVVCQPIGQTGAVTIAVDRSQYGRRR